MKNAVNTRFLSKNIWNIIIASRGNNASKRLFHNEGGCETPEWKNKPTDFTDSQRIHAIFRDNLESFRIKQGKSACRIIDMIEIILYTP